MKYDDFKALMDRYQTERSTTQKRTGKKKPAKKTPTISQIAAKLKDRP